MHGFRGVPNTTDGMIICKKASWRHGAIEELRFMRQLQNTNNLKTSD